MRDKLFSEYRKLYKRMHIYGPRYSRVHNVFQRPRVFLHGRLRWQTTAQDSPSVPRQTRVIVLIEGIMHTRGGGGSRHRLILQPWFKQSCQMLPLVYSLRQSLKSTLFLPPFSYSSKEYEFRD